MVRLDSNLISFFICLKLYPRQRSPLNPVSMGCWWYEMEISARYESNFAAHRNADLISLMVVV